MIFWTTLAVYLGILLGGAALSGILGMLIFRGYLALEDYRSILTLSRLRCPSCGSQFGMAASRAARDDYEKQMEEERKSIAAELESGTAIDINPSFEWEPICPSCQKSIRYNYVERIVVSKSHRPLQVSRPGEYFTCAIAVGLVLCLYGATVVGMVSMIKWLFGP